MELFRQSRRSIHTAKSNYSLLFSLLFRKHFEKNTDFHSRYRLADFDDFWYRYGRYLEKGYKIILIAKINLKSVK